MVDSAGEHMNYVAHAMSPDFAFDIQSSSWSIDFQPPSLTLGDPIPTHNFERADDNLSLFDSFSRQDNQFSFGMDLAHQRMEQRETTDLMFGSNFCPECCQYQLDLDQRLGVLSDEIVASRDFNDSNLDVFGGLSMPDTGLYGDWDAEAAPDFRSRAIEIDVDGELDPVEGQYRLVSGHDDNDGDDLMFPLFNSLALRSDEPLGINDDFELEEIDVVNEEEVLDIFSGDDDVRGINENFERQVLDVVNEQEVLDMFSADDDVIGPGLRRRQETVEEVLDVEWDNVMTEDFHLVDMINRELSLGVQIGEQLLEGEDTGAGTGKPPASEKAIERLVNVVVSTGDLEMGNVICAVCKDDMNVGEMARELPCLHRYHRDCILPWLKIRNTCPVCRFELTTDDPDYENAKAHRAGHAN